MCLPIFREEVSSNRRVTFRDILHVRQYLRRGRLRRNRRLRRGRFGLRHNIRHINGQSGLGYVPVAVKERIIEHFPRKGPACRIDIGRGRIGVIAIALDPEHTAQRRIDNKHPASIKCFAVEGGQSRPVREDVVAQDISGNGSLDQLCLRPSIYIQPL